MTTLSVIKATIRWKANPVTKQMTLNEDKVMFAIKQAEWEGREEEHPLDDEIFFWLEPKEAEEICAGYDMGDWKVMRVNSRREITVLEEGVPNVSTNN